MIGIEDNQKPANIFLEIAKKDLEAAKCLYKNELYLQATFYLQQSAEKVLKSFALKMNLIGEKDLGKKVHHNMLEIDKNILNEVKEKTKIWKNPTSTKIIERAIKEFSQHKIEEKTRKRIKENKEIKERAEKAADIMLRFKESSLIDNDIILEINQDADKRLKAIDSYNKKNKNYVPFSKEGEQEIKELISYIKKINESELQVKEQAKEISKHNHVDSFVTDKEVDGFKQEIRKNLNMFSDIIDPTEAKEVEAFLNSPYSSKYVKDITNIILHMAFEKFFDPLRYYRPLYYLSVVMSHHAITTRYPTNDFNPLEIYTYNFPLIESFDILIQFMDKALVR